MAIRLVADTALIQLALFCALTVRFCIVVVFELQLQDVEGTSEVEKLLHLYINSYVGHFAPLTIFCLIIFFLNGFYTYGRYYQGRYKALIVVQAVSLAFLLYFPGRQFLMQGEGIEMPRGAVVVAWLLCCCCGDCCGLVWC